MLLKLCLEDIANHSGRSGSVSTPSKAAQQCLDLDKVLNTYCIMPFALLLALSVGRIHWFIQQKQAHKSTRGTNSKICYQTSPNHSKGKRKVNKDQAKLNRAGATITVEWREQREEALSKTGHKIRQKITTKKLTWRRRTRRNKR